MKSKRPHHPPPPPPRGSHSPSVSHFPRLVNNKVLLAACSAMAEHKDAVLRGGFHRRNSPHAGRQTLIPGASEDRNSPRRAQGAWKHGSVMLAVRVFHQLSSPFTVLHLKKLLHWGRWEIATAKCRSSFSSWRPLPDSGPTAKTSDTSWTDLRLFVSLSPCLARPRLSLALRCNPSRHSLGWRPTVTA